MTIQDQCNNIISSVIYLRGFRDSLSKVCELKTIPPHIRKHLVERKSEINKDIDRLILRLNGLSRDQALFLIGSQPESPAQRNILETHPEILVVQDKSREENHTQDPA